MLRITVSWAQWQSGLNQSILEDTISPISYLECRWLSSLREFLKTINGRILLDTPGIPHAERRNDIHIMRVAIDCGLFNDQDLKILNYCRLYLHVATVSELFNVAGTEMLPEMYDCKREPWFDPTSYVTLQKRPSDYQVRKKWQKLCRLWINDQGHASESTRLGEWTSSGGSLRRRRQTYMIVHRPFRVYHWIENCYWKYQPVEGNPRVFQKTLPTDWTPNHQCVPIDASLRTDGFLIVNTRIPTQPEKQPDPRLEITFGQSLRESPSWETELFSNVVLHKGPEIATQALLLLPEDERQLIMVSDGSVRGTSSTYGWVFGTTKKDRYAENFGLGNGETTSHRAEAWGMLSGVVFVSRYVAAMQSKQSTSLKPSVTFYSDNKGLVERVSNRLKYNENYPNATLKPDWDLVEQITATIRQIGLHMVSIQWVKGHQEGDPNDLPPEVAFNLILPRTSWQRRPICSSAVILHLRFYRPKIADSL